jgi:hypothetical protein
VKARTPIVAAIVTLLVAGVTVGAAAAGESAWTRFSASRWRVTRGQIAPLPSGGARVTEPTVRAVAPGSDGSRARLRFVYRGPSAGEARLASGELRRQIGLKLRAEDGCNLVYVMWRIAPRPGLVVSVKRNPGARTHRECGVRGYRNLVATAGTAALLAAPAPGSPHVLAATLDGTALTVEADGVRAWQGDLGDAAALRGPAGWRSDNGEFDVELDAVAGVEKGGDGDED